MKFYFVSLFVVGLCFILCNGQKRKEIQNKKHVKHISTKIYRPSKEMYSKYLSMNPPRFPPTFIHTRLRVPHKQKIPKLKWKPKAFYIRTHKNGKNVPKTVTRINNKDARRTSPNPFPSTRRIYRGKGIPGRKPVRRKPIPKIKEFIPQTKPVFRQTIQPRIKQTVRKITTFPKRTIPVYTTTIKPRTQRPIHIYKPAPNVMPAIGPKMTKGPPQFNVKIGIPTSRPYTPNPVLKTKPSIKIQPPRRPNFDSRLTSFRPLPVGGITAPTPKPVLQKSRHPKPVERITTQRPKVVWEMNTKRPKLTRPTVRPRPEIFTRRPTTRQRPFSPIIFIRPKPKPSKPALPIRRQQSTLPPIKKQQTAMPPIIVPPLMPALFEEAPLPPVLISKILKKIAKIESTPKPPVKVQPTPKRGDSPMTYPDTTTQQPLLIVPTTHKYVTRQPDRTTNPTTQVQTTKQSINIVTKKPTVETTKKYRTTQPALTTTTEMFTTIKPYVYKDTTRHAEKTVHVGIIPQETTTENILTTKLGTTTEITTPTFNVWTTQPVIVPKDIVVNSMSPIYPHFTTSGDKLNREGTESTTVGRQITTFTNDKTTNGYVRITERQMPVVIPAESLYTTSGPVISTTVMSPTTSTEKTKTATEITTQELTSTTKLYVTTTTPEVTTTAPTTTTEIATTPTIKTTEKLTTTPEVTTTKVITAPTTAKLTTTTLEISTKDMTTPELTTVKHEDKTKKINMVNPPTKADIIAEGLIPSYLVITPGITTRSPTTEEPIQMKHSHIVTGIPLYMDMMSDHFTTTTEETKTIKGVFVHLPESTTKQVLSETKGGNKEEDTEGSRTLTTQETSDVSSLSQSVPTYFENMTETTTLSLTTTSQAQPPTEAETSTNTDTSGSYDVYTGISQFESIPLKTTPTSANLITNESSTTQSVTTISNSVAGSTTMTEQKSTAIPQVATEQLTTSLTSQEPSKPSTTTFVPPTELIFNMTEGTVSYKSTETITNTTTSRTTAVTTTPQSVYSTSTTTHIPSTTSSTTSTTELITDKTTKTPRQNATTTGQNATTTGQNATTTGQNATTTGQNATTTEQYATTTGQNATTMMDATTMPSDVQTESTTESSQSLENTTLQKTTPTTAITPASTTVVQQGGCINVGCPNGRQCVTKLNTICSPGSGEEDCFCIPGCRLENMYVSLGQPVIIDRCGNLCYCSTVGLTACTKLPCNRNKYATSTINPFKPVEFKPDIKDRGPTRGDAPYFYEDNSKSMRVHGLHFPEQSLAWLSPFSSEFRDKLPMSGLKEISIDDLFKT